MMSLSLVAYGSSDEGSDSEPEDHGSCKTTEKSKEIDNRFVQDLLSNNDVDATQSNDTVSQNPVLFPQKKQNSTIVKEDHISDDADDILVANDEIDDLTLGLKLPPAKHCTTIKADVTSHPSNNNTSNTSNDVSVLGLPAPKVLDRKTTPVQNLTEDDELEEMVKPKAAELAQRVQPPGKKKHKTIKIAVPSISNFDSDEEDEVVKKKPTVAAGGSGLFALLPQPKNVSIKEAGRSLIPHTLTKKPATVTPSALKPSISKPDSIRPPQPTAGGQHETAASDDDDDEVSTSGNYFSIGEMASSLSSQPETLLSTSSYAATSSLSTLPPVKRQKSSVIDKSGESYVADIPLPSKSDGLTFVGPSAPSQAEGKRYYPERLEPVSNTDYNMAGIDEVCIKEEDDDIGPIVPPEQLLRLQGKRKWGKEEINIIDVHADQQTNTVELTKHLTEEVDMISHSKKKKDQPTGQQKRKHQITYLAHKAKEREFDLKNQWAQNKMTKRQSQSKYGF